MMRVGVKLLLFGAVVLGAASARAQGSTALILSYVGRSGPDLAPFVEAVARPLATVAPRWDAELGADIERQLGPPTRSLDARTVDRYKKRLLALARDLGLGNNTAACIGELERMRRTLVENQGSLAFDTSARKLYYRVLLRLALAYSEARRQAKAIEYMMEVVRTFPDWPVELNTDDNFEIALVEMYRRVRSMLERTRGTLRIDGSLRIAKNRPPGKVYVNGRRVIDFTIPGMRDYTFPVMRGEYDVFAETPSGDTRVHHVNVRGEGETVVRMDAAFEVSLSTGQFTGFRFDTPEEQALKERAFVTQLGQRMGFRVVVVLAHIPFERNPTTRLTAYAVPIDRNPKARLAAYVVPSNDEDYAQVLGSYSVPGKLEELKEEQVMGLAGMLLSKIIAAGRNIDPTGRRSAGRAQ